MVARSDPKHFYFYFENKIFVFGYLLGNKQLAAYPKVCSLHFCFCFSDSLDWIGYDEKFKGKLPLIVLNSKQVPFVQFYTMLDWVFKVLFVSRSFPHPYCIFIIASFLLFVNP